VQFHRLAVSLLIFLSPVVALSATGASGDVWGMEQEELSARVSRGDYEFLAEVSPDSGSADEILRLGDEAPFHVGLAALNAQPALAEELFRLAWDRSDDPWAGEAVVELLGLLSAEERFRELEDLAKEASARYAEDPDSPYLVTSRRFLAEAFYQQRDDAGVLSIVTALPGDAEVALWYAVSSSRTGRPGWPERYRELYRDYAADEAHSRVWVYLTANPLLASRFGTEELAFFRAKQLHAEGRIVEAVELYGQLAASLAEPALDPLPPWADLLLSPYGLLDYYRAASVSGRQSSSAQRLVALAKVAEPDMARRALEYAGRLYRTAGAYSAAIPPLEASLLLQSGDDERRVRWYLVSTLVRRDPVAAVAALPQLLAPVTDPYYFADVLDELAGLLAEGRQWEALVRAYRALEPVASPGTRASYELVIAEAIRGGYISPAAAGGETTDFLQRAAGQTEDILAALVASALLGRSGEDLILRSAAAPEWARPGDASEAGAAGMEEREMLVQAALAYGLFARAYELGRGLGPQSSPLLLELADRLAAAGMVRESIQIALRAGPGVDAHGDSSGEITARDVLTRRHPRAYAELFAAVLSREAGLDPALLYALVREESLFDPKVVSIAGAVGLTQLLPSTAEDVARRMRRDVTDLTDPGENLALGARYFSMLNEQFGGPLRAIAAYNAGQGRVRSWERRWSELRGVLFLRAIPFGETHNHVRKVVVSAAYYGYLYEGRSPADAVRIILEDAGPFRN
jgi:soluble lytic murein transglycosylase-like protein